MKSRPTSSNSPGKAACTVLLCENMLQQKLGKEVVDKKLAVSVHKHALTVRPITAVFCLPEGHGHKDLYPLSLSRHSRCDLQLFLFEVE